MIKKAILIIGLLVFGVVGFGQALVKKARFEPNVIIAKLNPENPSYFESSDLKGSQIERVTQMFPNHRIEGKLANGQVDLSLIYRLNLKDGGDVELVIQELTNLDVFEYVERLIINEIAFTPNDPSINNQNYLNQINAYSGWDVSKGNTSIKVGIVDSGTDLDHPDLQSEMYLNTADPINGVDDDNDGFIDNYHGWDFYEGDNNPQIGDNAHGIHVAGIAAAATDNNEGVAAVGFNSQFLAIRAGNGVSITHGYQGVIYAADMGCDVINCSWGSFGFTSFGQDAVNYATFNKDALVVAAAGNSGQERNYYPAAYESVLGVLSVNDADAKSSFSNYGNWVGISAPGENIYSCVDDGMYNYNTGTSMAAPVVAGAAALLKSVFPQLSAKQLAERLKTTSTDVSAINLGLNHKMGHGRLDLNAAVSGNITEASIVFENKVISNKNDDVFKAGDSLFISGTFTNYLATSNNATATIFSNSPYISINKDVENLGVVASLVQLDNFNQPFSFKIDVSTPINTMVTFELTITDGVFSNTQLIDVLVNVDYLNIAINDLATTLSSKGMFGYNARNQIQGLGVQFQGGSSQLFEGGLMIGTDNNNFIRVMDRVRSTSNNWDNDFGVVDNVKEIIPSQFGHYQVEGLFNDSLASGDMIGIDVFQRGFASTDLGHEKYIVLEYHVINTGSDSIQNINIGLFADFDIADYSKNATYTDLTKVCTYTISTEPGAPLYGVQLLTPGAFRSYAMDNLPGGAGGVNINDGFSTSEKFTTLTSNRYGAGFTDVSGNDVIQVTSSANINLASGDTAIVAFALLAAESKLLLDQVADSAYYRYNGNLPNSVSELKDISNKVAMYPNPSSNKVTVALDDLNNAHDWHISMFDVTGKMVYQRLNIQENKILLDLNILKPGLYFVDIQTSFGSSKRKLIKK
ncbi:MAG: S8/S53 family peptidase [Salibacteraceae bacterium]